MAATTGFAHVGIVANDPAVLAGFYCDVLGMTITGGSGAEGPYGATAFLSSRPGEEDHELAIFTDARFRHLAFKVSSLKDLRAAWHLVIAQGTAIKQTMVHDSSLAFYFDDPEGNMVEIYWSVDLRNRRPGDGRIDIGGPEDELIAQVARMERSGSD